MCILLYVKHIWCSGIPYIYGRLDGSTSALSICAFCYMLNYLVWYSIDLWLIGEGTCALAICVFCYMCNLCGVVVFHRSIVTWRGTSALGICAFCYMLNLSCVVVFHRSMVNWRRGALVYLHSVICETYFGVAVFHTSVVN